MVGFLQGEGKGGVAESHPSVMLSIGFTAKYILHDRNVGSFLPKWGVVDAEIKVPSVENSDLCIWRKQPCLWCVDGFIGAIKGVAVSVQVLLLALRPRVLDDNNTNHIFTPSQKAIS